MTPKPTALSYALSSCKGKKSCDFAACMKEHVGTAPKWSHKKCPELAHIRKEKEFGEKEAELEKFEHGLTTELSHEHKHHDRQTKHKT